MTAGDTYNQAIVPYARLSAIGANDGRDYSRPPLTALFL
jgi:hypothetical protein